MLLFFCKEFAKEFDYKNEFIQTVIGRRVYHQKSARKQDFFKGLKVAAAISYGENPFPFLVLQRVPGYTLDKLLTQKNTNMNWKGVYKQLFVFLKKWFEAALFDEKSFFHADVHPGNIMWDGKDLVLIDFGSTGLLSKREQCAMISAMVISGNLHWTDNRKTDYETKQILLNNEKFARQFVDAIWRVCKVPFTADKESQMNYVVSKILNYKRHYFRGNGDNQVFEFGYLFIDTVKYSRDIGTCLSSNILLYGRAISYLSNTISSISSKCKGCPNLTVGAFIEKLFVANFFKLLVSCPRYNRKIIEQENNNTSQQEKMQARRELAEFFSAQT